MDLKPCKCGSKDVFSKIAFVAPRKYSVKCNYCGREMSWFNTAEEAESEWNRRVGEGEKK